MKETSDYNTLICPYCAERLSHPDEYFSLDRDNVVMDCPECNKTFMASRLRSVLYCAGALPGRS